MTAAALAQALKRYLFLGVAAAAMLAVVRPPLPIRGGAKCPRLPFHLCPRLWDETHVPSHAVDDVNVYGGGLEWRTHWALWLLVLAVALAALAATLQPRARRALPRWRCCAHAESCRGVCTPRCGNDEVQDMQAASVGRQLRGWRCPRQPLRW